MFQLRTDFPKNPCFAVVLLTLHLEVVWLHFTFHCMAVLFQVYLYEYGEDMTVESYPRHVLPYAVIHFRYKDAPSSPRVPESPPILRSVISNPTKLFLFQLRRRPPAPPPPIICFFGGGGGSWNCRIGVWIFLISSEPLDLLYPSLVWWCIMSLSAKWNSWVAISGLQ